MPAYYSTTATKSISMGKHGSDNRLTCGVMLTGSLSRFQYRPTISRDGEKFVHVEHEGAISSKADGN
jgi:hypothetical protein